MNQIITIQKSVIGAESVNSVNARELHSNIESKQEFSAWIKNRIEKYDFKENDDFVSFDKVIKREIGATTVKDYIITLDMAKELAMVENTPKGREVRKYFIECEKQFAAGLTQYKEVQGQVDLAVRELSKKSLEADTFKAKYYETLEMTNKLLIQKIEMIENSDASVPMSFLGTGTGKHLREDEKREIIRLKRAGYSYSMIGKEIGRSDSCVSRFARNVA